MSAKKPAEALGHGCLLVFSLSFALAGVAILYQGLVRRLRTVEIQRVRVDIGMSQGRTMTQKVRAWYDVNLHPAGGRRVTAGGAIRDKSHAERFAELLREQVSRRNKSL